MLAELHQSGFRFLCRNPAVGDVVRALARFKRPVKNQAAKKG